MKYREIEAKSEDRDSPHYFKVNIGEKRLEKINVKDKSAGVQTMKMPEEIEWVSEFAVDLNSDIYISSSDGNNGLTLYKIAAGSEKAVPVDNVRQTIHYVVLKNNIAYMDYYIEKNSQDLYYNGTLVAENIMRFTLLNEKYLIYTIYTENMTEDVYLYDIESGSTEQLKTFTDE